MIVFCLTQLQVSVDQKHLAEARSGILSILHTIMSSVTLLWSALYLADSSERPSGATCSSNINLGSTKVRNTHLGSRPVGRRCFILFCFVLFH